MMDNLKPSGDPKGAIQDFFGLVAEMWLTLTDKGVSEDAATVIVTKWVETNTNVKQAPPPSAESEA